MAITNYGELKTAVQDYLGRDDLTARIPDFIAAAEDRIALDVRVRELEGTADVTINARSIALPTGYLGTRRFYIDSDPISQLDFVAPDHFWSIYASSQTGKPKVYTIEGENFIFGPAPDLTYTGKWLGYVKPTAFVDDTDTTALLGRARMLYVYAALLEAESFIGNDPRLLIWSNLYEDIVERLNQSNEMDRFSGPIAQRSSVTGTTLR